MAKKGIFSIFLMALLVFGMFSPVQANTAKVYWDGLMMVPGQIGKIQIIKPINLWKRDGNRLVFERVLNPGEQYRVYRYDQLHGGQYGVGGGYYITNMKGFVDYRTPSKKKLAELEAIYGKPTPKPPPNKQITLGKVVSEDVKNLAPGLKQVEMEVDSSRGPQKIYAIEYDGKSNNISVETGLARGQLYGFETVSGQANRTDADVIAGINGDYFDRNGHPIDLMIHQGHIVSTSQTPQNELAVFGVRQNGAPIIGSPSVDLTVKINGQNPYKIDSVNRTRYANHLVLYNQYFSSSTRTNHLGTEVVVSITEGQLNGSSVLKGTVTKVLTGVGDEKINVNEFILSGHHLANQYLQNVSVGDQIEVHTSFSPREWNDVHEALSGRYHLVRNGTVLPQTVPGAHPRSAIGIKADGGIIAAVVDGRNRDHSVGVTLAELSTVMKDLGAYHAFTFDGGGSSTLVAKGDNNRLTVQNKPSDGFERSVANSLLFVTRTANVAMSRTFVTEPEAKKVEPTEPIVLVDSNNGVSSLLASGVQANHVSISEETEIIKEAKSSIKLDYDFTSMTGTSGAYINAVHPIEIPGKPSKIGLWVYGDGNKHWLRMQLKDGNGQTVQVDLAKSVDWNGWRYLEVDLPSTAAYPLSIEVPIRYMAIDGSDKTNGTIYIESVKALY